MAVANCIYDGLTRCGLSAQCVQLVETIDREAVGRLIQLNDYIDVIIPRGGKNLTSRIAQEATVPVIKHLDGLCHVYIDDYADRDKAIAVAFNAKARRYGICGAMETLLVSKSIASEVLPDTMYPISQTGILSYEDAQQA